MKYSVVTFGCRVNQAESLRYEEDLRRRGGEAVSPECADLVVVNSCSVTASADQGTRQTIRRIARDNPAARIVVTGCYATRRQDEVATLPGVIRLIPNDEKDRLVSTVTSELGMTSAERFGEGEGSCGAVIEPGVAGRTAYSLRVQTGCEERCTYCIIPSTRGRCRSRPIEAVVAEVVRLHGAGFKEVVLTGVHLGAYGRDLLPSATLLDLLRPLADRTADVLFRIGSLEPMDCTPAVVDLVSRSGRFAPHFHLPLQHAADPVLRAMRRPYTADTYRRLVDGVRDRLPHAFIGSDVIVGFPRESDADFQVMAAFLEASPLTGLHVFPYSDRPGTEAARLAPKVPGNDVRRRTAAIRTVAHELSRRFRDSQVGTVRPGLTLEDGTLVVTDNYLKVRIPPGRARNERVAVRILSAGETLAGTVRTVNEGPHSGTKNQGPS